MNDWYGFSPGLSALVIEVTVAVGVLVAARGCRSRIDVVDWSAPGYRARSGGAAALRFGVGRLIARACRGDQVSEYFEARPARSGSAVRRHHHGGDQAGRVQ